VVIRKSIRVFKRCTKGAIGNMPESVLVNMSTMLSDMLSLESPYVCKSSYEVHSFVESVKFPVMVAASEPLPIKVFTNIVCKLSTICDWRAVHALKFMEGGGMSFTLWGTTNRAVRTVIFYLSHPDPPLPSTKASASIVFSCPRSATRVHH
jgi:hypothetical protein